LGLRIWKWKWFSLFGYIIWVFKYRFYLMAKMKVRLRRGNLGKKNGKEAVGRGIDWGVSSPHTLLPKEEKEGKNAFLCVI
jgi:hypothetical protein